MRAKVKPIPSERALTRMLNAFAQELIEASDEEVLQAARDLGMDPNMKGSAAFLGVIHATPRRLSDFFDPEAVRQLLLMTQSGRLGREQRAKRPGQVQDPVKAGTKPSARARLASEKKPPHGK
jgi:hypothetical protein